MDIRCPSCNTLYEFDEARLKGGSVNLKCSQCSHVFRVEAPPTQHDKPRKRWMVRNTASGDILYFTEMTQLQKWIIDRSVSRTDEISKTGRAWKALGSIRELASLFEVADNIQRLQPESPASQSEVAPPHPREAKLTPPPTADFFDPKAPGVPAEDPTAPDPVAPPPALASGMVDSTPVEDALSRPPTSHGSTSSGRWNITVSPPPDEPAGPAIAIDSPPDDATFGTELPSLGLSTIDEPAGPVETGDFQAIGTIDDPLDLDPAVPQRNLVGPLVLVVVTLILCAGGIYLYTTGALGGLGLSTSPTSTPSEGSGDEADAAQAATTDQAHEDTSKSAAAATTDTDPASDDEDTTATAEADSAPPDKAPDKQATPTPEKVANTPAGKQPNTQRSAQSFDALMKRGYKYRSSGNPQEALKTFQKALQMRPGSAEAQSAIGWCHLGLGNTTKAITAFQTALKANPKYADAYIGLGHAYNASGQSGKALESYRTYLTLSPRGPKANTARKLIDTIKNRKK